MIATEAIQQCFLPEVELVKPIETVPQVVDWLKKFRAETLQSFVNTVEASRQLLRTLEDEYISADSFITASFTEEIEVLADDLLALTARTTTLEAQVQTPTTGLLARVTVTEASIATNTTAIAGINTEIIAAREGESSLLAKINVVESAIVTGDAAVASSVTTLTATVNTKTQTFRQTSTPTAISVGDLWIDSDDNNKLYRATAAGTGSWVATDDSRIASTLATVNNIAEAYATNNGSTARLMWEVAVGTNVASLVQTAHSGYSDGTWNGSKISLSATYIELNGDVIINGTLTYNKIGVNQITEAEVDETDAAETIGNTFETVASIDVTTPDANTLVFLAWSIYVEGDSDGSLMDGRIQRDGVTIYSTEIAGNPPEFSETFVDEGLIEYRPVFNGQVSGFDTDAPGAADTYTYTLQVRVAGSVSPAWQVSKRRLFGLLFKR